MPPLVKRQRKHNMNPSNSNGSTSEPIKTQSTLFDLDTMEEVLVLKTVPFTDVTRTEEALERLGNNADRLIAVINRGLRAEIAQDIKRDTNIPWQIENEEGNLVDFTGTLVDAKTVNTLALNMAKSIFGYSKEQPIEKRREAKAAALNVIKNTEVIRENFKKQAALGVTEE